ncbi:MAG: EAL domain-containing protein [Lachnospiraceae bacterium]|nr:EAL domain-containing protein [Lachnospiraceae bacterium]
MDNKDKLTGLYFFDDFIKVASDELEKAKSDNLYILISSDFSKFKYINRVYSYVAGDKLIKDLADAFCAQEECIVACRPYSDHIIGLFSVKSDEWSVEKERLKKLAEDFCKSHKKEYSKTSVHLNIGICMVEDTNEAVTSIIDKANIARRSVKGNYSVPYCVYTSKLQMIKEAESRLIPIFEDALENKDILVYMQPKISVKKGCIKGAEALTRLEDEEGRIVPPDIFIPVLENSGKVLDLDWYVMVYVFEKIREWLDEGREVVPISVNLSKLHFYHDSLVEDIIAEFEKYNIPAKYVEFEVTESVFFEEAELIIDKIEKLRQYGFKISVDDFGAGYSSLNLIGILPVDIIKLDKGFIKNSLNNKKGMDIIKGLIRILNEIELDIVCEGIETKAEEKIVYEFGCDSMQGFLYDKPIPINSFEDKYILKQVI